MNRKTVILLLSVLAAMVGLIAIAVALLYSNDGAGNARSSDIAEESRYMLLPAVPSDAVALLCLSDASDARSLTPFGEFDCRMAVSLHFSGKLVPLYVLDAGKASEQMSKKAGEFVAKAKEAGMACEYLDCSAIAPRSSGLNSRSIVIASPSEVILRSARRHIEKNVSILDLHDFAEAASSTHLPMSSLSAMTSLPVCCQVCSSPLLLPLAALLLHLQNGQLPGSTASAKVAYH